MIRLPNKLYRFNGTVLADFVTILRTLDVGQSTTVSNLHQQLGTVIATEDLIEALALLLTLGRLYLDTESGMITRAH